MSSPRGTNTLAAESPPGTQIARIAGVPITVTGGALLVAGWLALIYAEVLAGRYPQLGDARLPAALLFPTVFVTSVLLHETGHAVAGRRCGLRVRWIVIDGLGGETEFDDDCDRPGPTAWVAGAGPAVSIALAVILGTAATGLGSADSIVHLVLVQGALGNAILAVFNLLPGLPLDGGHLLRALVWRLTGKPHLAATVSAAAGLALAAGIVIVPLALLAAAGAKPGVLGIAILALAAWPIGSASWATLREQRRENTADSASAHDLSRPAVTVHPAASVGEAIRLLTARGAAALVVRDHSDRRAGTITAADLAQVPAASRDLVAVGQIAHLVAANATVSPRLSGEQLRAHIRRADAALLVVDYGEGRDPRVLWAIDALHDPNLGGGPRQRAGQITVERFGEIADRRR